MHDIHQAIEVLREITGQPDIAFDDRNHVEIVFDDTPVGFVGVDLHNLELVTPLAASIATLDRAALTRLMNANYLGIATGAARLAVDPARNQVALCERLDLRALDAGGLRNRVGSFLTSTAFWNGPDGRAIAAGPPATEPELPTMDQYIIRG